MRRRRFLAGTVAASTPLVAGCFGDEGNRSTGDADPPATTYGEHDFYFGTDGYDVETEEHVSVNVETPLEVAFEVTSDRFSDGPDVTISLEITNQGTESYGISRGPPDPFGIFVLGSEDRGIVAWTDAYLSDPLVSTDPVRGVTAVTDSLHGTSLPQGEPVRERYRITDRTRGLQPGTYTLAKTPFILHGPGIEDGRMEFDATLDIEPAGREVGDVEFDLAVAEVLEDIEVPWSLSVEPLEPVTDAYPGLLEIAIENHGDERISLRKEGFWPFGAYLGLSATRKGLVLLPEDIYAPGYVTQDASGWWRSDTLPFDTFGRNDLLDPGERRSKRYVVAGHPLTSPPETGDTYRFEDDYGEDGQAGSLGFDLVLQG